MNQTTEQWTRNVLEIVRRWEWMGRQDPSPAATFSLDGTRYTVRIIAGNLSVMADSKGFTHIDGDWGPVDEVCQKFRESLPKPATATSAEELRCSDCGALGYEWCPGCRSEVFPGRWGRDG